MDDTEPTIQAAAAGIAAVGRQRRGETGWKDDAINILLVDRITELSNATSFPRGLPGSPPFLRFTASRRVTSPHQSLVRSTSLAAHHRKHKDKTMTITYSKFVSAALLFASGLSAQTIDAYLNERNTGNADLGASATIWGMARPNYGGQVSTRLRARVDGSYRQLARVRNWSLAIQNSAPYHRLIGYHGTTVCFDEYDPSDASLSGFYDPSNKTARTCTGEFNIGGFRIETEIEFGARISATSYPDLFTRNGQALADGDVNVDMRAWERSCTGQNLDGSWAVFDMNFWMHHDPRADFDSTLSSASGNVRMLSGGENRVLLRITAGGWFPFSDTVSEDDDTFGYQRLFMQ